MEKTLTKREVLNYLIKTYGEDTKVVEYAQHELELLDRKNSNRATKNVEEDSQILDLIINALKDMTTEDKKMFTVTEILKHEILRDYIVESTGRVLSNPKATNLLRKEMESATSRVVNIKDKKNSFYGLA